MLICLAWRRKRVEKKNEISASFPLKPGTAETYKHARLFSSEATNHIVILVQGSQRGQFKFKEAEPVT